MVFQNSNTWQQEARAQIELPPGGVVSRLTLWVNGDEREAVFAARGKVRAAYESVVRQRRDPVLVTSTGVDRVMVQCFPVPPEGEMKIRVGITAPLTLESKDRGLLRLPGILERNFAIGNNIQHSVWIESKKPLESTPQSLTIEHSGSKQHTLRGLISNEELTEVHPAIRALRSPDVNLVWTRDPVSKTGEIIQQRLEERDAFIPARAVMVIDGSRGMKEHISAVAGALTKMPERIEFAAIISSDQETDEVIELSSILPSTPDNYRSIAERLQRVDYQGGSDNLPALERAWDLAAQSPNSAIIWIHGPNPVLLGKTEELRQRFERRPNNPRLFDLQTSTGPSRISESLNGFQTVHSITRMGDLAHDIERLFASWQGGAKQLSLLREKIPSNKISVQSSSQETSSHLARLWAFDEVIRSMNSDKQNRFEETVRLATSYRLVTPVTGAVVLETKEQYENAGLDPASTGAVSSVPEPEAWLLMITGALIMLWALKRRRALNEHT